MYYLGFLKQNTKDVVIFKSIKAPSRKDFTYFVRVMGPYKSEAGARTGLHNLKKAYGEYGYREESSCPKDHVHSGKCARYGNPLKATVDKAVRLTRKFLRAYEAFRQENPGRDYHDQRFIRFMGELEKYNVGSPPYIATLAKAYEHLQSAKDSERQKVR
jgi:hypothetical protein